MCKRLGTSQSFFMPTILLLLSLLLLHKGVSIHLQYIKKDESKMIKRLCAMTLAALLFVGCAAPEGKETAKTNEKETDESGIEVDKGVFNVELTLPSALFSAEEIEEIEAEITKNSDADVTKNDDGSINVKMSKKDHKKLLTEMKEEFAKAMDEIVTGDEFPSIEGISANKALNEVLVKVDKKSFEDSIDGFVIYSIGISSLLYQAFDGKDIEKEKTTVILVDEDGESFQEIVFPDAFEELEKEIGE